MEEKQGRQKPKNRFPFTKKTLAAIPYSNGKQEVYYDNTIKGLGLRVGSRTKTFFLYRRVKGGRPVRITIGEFPLLSMDAVEKAVNELSGELMEGKDRLYEERMKTLAKADQKKQLEARKKANAEGKAIAFEDVYTVNDVFLYYVQEQLIHNKGNQRITETDSDGNVKVIQQSSTLKDAELMVKYFDQKTILTLKKVGDKWEKDAEITLPSWLDKPFREITAKMVVERFDYLSRACPTRTNKEKPLAPIKRTHQLVFKYALSAFSFTINRLKFDLTYSGKAEALVNPFEVLSATKKWKKAEVRERYIDFYEPECYKWWNAVLNYKKANGVVSDYILFSLIQAGRSIDIASLTWDKVNFKDKTILYAGTKNDKNYTFPLTRLALEIIERRLKHKKGDKFIFEYPESKNGYVPPDCKDHFKAIAQASGVLVSHHDLRRSWSTLARHVRSEDAQYAVIMDERNIDYCLKHSRNDVNEHYFKDKKREITKTLQIVEDALIRKVAEFENQAKQKSEEKNMELA